MSTDMGWPKRRGPGKKIDQGGPGQKGINQGGGQGHFQALCHTTIFVSQIEFVKGQRPFLTPKTRRNQYGVCKAL